MEAELDTDKLQEKVEKLKQLLDESNDARNKTVEQADLLITAAAGDKAEIEHLRDELKSFREDASRFSREDDRKIRHLQREKQESDKKIARLKSEVAELRSVIQQYVGEINSGLGSEVTSALHTELNLVRQQAETDLNKMREKLKARELNDSAGVAELDLLRQEFDSLQQNGETHREALAEADKAQRRLREEAEERLTEIQRLQRALDIAREEVEKVEERRLDQLEVSKQVEESLNDAREELEQLREHQAAAAAGFVGNRLDIVAFKSLNRHKIIAALFGALIAFALAEGISIISGKGELITGLADNGPQDSVFEFPARERRKITLPESDSDPAPEKISKATKTESETDQPERRLPQADSGPVAGGSMRDRLRVGGSGPEMTKLRGGEFSMGQRRDQLATDERPLHPVKLNSFAIGKYEVTFDEYLVFARASGRKIPSDQGWGRGQRPVINVSWTDASAYAAWLSGQTGKTYRLPTEAEWEFAAGGGTDSFYWWGYALGENQASCFDCGSRWDGKSTAPVGSFAANPYAVHDTAGNVMEWVADCYHRSYQGAPIDGSAWMEKDCSQYVARGGAFNKPGDSLHTTRRFHYQPDTRLPILGFRVVREVD